MKIFQLNFISVLFLTILIGLGVLLPSYIIQAIWNSSALEFSFERDLSISLWQASLLWGSALMLLYSLGIFKVKLDFKTLDSIDVNQINDPDLKDEIEKLKAEYKRQENIEKKRQEIEEFKKTLDQEVKGYTDKDEDDS